MIVDEEVETRKKAANFILKSRRKESNRQRRKVRVFRKPKLSWINEEANHYSEILNWEALKRCKFKCFLIYLFQV